MKNIIRTHILIGSLLLLSACGQKGPLIVEQPPLEAPQTQEEELAPVK